MLEEGPVIVKTASKLLVLILQSSCKHLSIDNMIMVDLLASRPFH